MSRNYSNEELLRMYDALKKGRLFTLKMHECVTKGLIRSSFHTPYGQEAVGIGTAMAMQDQDWMGFTHRLQLALIQRYGLVEFIGELFALDAGANHGSAFDFHLMDVDDGPDSLRILPTTGSLGQAVPQELGFAWGRKLKFPDGDDVCMIPHGDAGCSEGAVYEAWNLAALFKPRAVFLIDNNEWGMTVPIERQTFVKDISKKAEACGLPATIVDGTDILAVREAMDNAFEMARQGQPNVVETKSLRWDAHFVGQGDDYRKGYDSEKVEEAKKNRDSVAKYEKFMIDQGLIDQAYIDKLTTAYEAEVDKAIEVVIASGKPKFEDIYRMDTVYTQPETGGAL